MPVRVSRVSRLAATLIIALGIFTLVAGLSAGILENTIAGAAFTVLGVVLYRLLYSFSGKVQREIETEEPTR